MDPVQKALSTVQITGKCKLTAGYCHCHVPGSSPYRLQLPLPLSSHSDPLPLKKWKLKYKLLSAFRKGSWNYTHHEASMSPVCRDSMLVKLREKTTHKSLIWLQRDPCLVQTQWPQAEQQDSLCLLQEFHLWLWVIGFDLRLAAS